MKTELDLSWCDFGGNKIQQTTSTKLNRLKSISDEKLSTICHPIKASPLYNSLPPLPDLIPIKKNLNLINNNYKHSISDNSNNTNYNKSRSCSNLNLSRKNNSSCNNSNSGNDDDDVCPISRENEYRNCSNSMSPKHCYNEWKPPSVQRPKLQPNNKLVINDDENYCNMLSKHNNNNNNNCDNKNENIISNCSNNSKSNSRTIRQQKSRHKRRHSLTAANNVNTSDSAPNKPSNGCAAAVEAKSRINPIFLWVKQNDSHIIEVKCEDYDHRNRIRLTKTSSGWKAIPRTEQNSSLSTNSSLESSNSSSGNSCKKNKKKKKKHKKKNKHHHRRKLSIEEEDEDEQEPQKTHHQPEGLKLIPHKPLLEPVEMKVELTRIKLDEIEGYDDDDEDDEEPQIIEKAAELVVAVPEHVADEEEEDEDDDDEENHSVTVIPPDDEDEEEEDIEEIEEVEEVDEEVEEIEDHHYNNIINDSTKELMDGIRNMENIAANTIEVDLLDDDDDDHNESTINGSELIDSLVKQGCEDHNIISSEEDEIKNHMDDYNDDDDILLTEEPVVSDIISRLNDSLSSPKCLSFNEAGEIEGISDVFNTHSTSSLDNLSITISEFHNDKSNKNVLDNSNSKIVSPDSCQQDQFHPKDLRICKTNNSSNNISVNSNNSGNVSDNNNISKKNLESPDLSITLISRPISRSSDTIQSPQPSGIPAVPPSPDLLFHKNNFINLNHPFKLPPTQKSIQKEPLDLGTSIYRKSASPTVSCSQETERISIESCSPKRIKMEHKSLEKVIENLRSPSQNSMSSISTMTPTPTPSHHNTSASNIIDLVDIDDDDDNNNNHSIRTNASKNTNSSSGHFIHRNNDPDPLTQLRLLVSNPEWKVPDPLLVPKDRLNAILESPAREIPLLLTTRPELRLPEAFSFPNILQDPDIMVVSLSQLEMILVKQDELLKAANVVVPTVPPVISNKQQQQQQQHVPETLDKPTNNCSSLKYNNSSNNSSSRDSNGKGHVKSKSSSQTQQQQQQAAAAAAAAVAAAIAPTTNLLPNSLASEIDAATMAAFNQMFWLPYPAGQLNPADLLKIPEINQFNTSFPYQNLPTTNQNNNNNSNNNFNGCPPDLSAMLQEAARQMSNNYFLQALKLSQSRWNNNNSSSNQNLHQNNSSSNNNSNHTNSNNVTNVKKRPQNMLPQEFIHPQLNHHNNGNYPPSSPRHTSSGNNHNSSNNNNINWNINPNHNYSKLQQSSRSSSSSSSTTTTHNPFASPPYYQDSPQNVFNHHHLGQLPPQHQSTPKIKQQKMSSHHPSQHSNSNNQHHHHQQQQQQHNNQYSHHNSLSANLNHLMSSHKTEKPRVTCKSLLNLLQPNQSSHQAAAMQHHPHLQRFNSTGSSESISSEIDMQLHHNNMMTNHNNNNNNNNNSGSNNSNHSNNHSQAKLKVKPGSHLLDPAAAQRKLLNDDISDVVSTTSGIEDVLNDPNMSLWHPLFGNTQNGNYTSPWHWTTVTATGE